MAQTEEKNINEADFVSYCGLFCPDCPLFSGKVSDLAKDLRKELRRVEYDKFAKYISKFPSGKELKNFKECYSVLGTLMKFRCERGCRLGGGAENCQIKQCNIDQNIQGCWQCKKFKYCKKLDTLTSLHGNAHRKNLEKIEKIGISEFIKGTKHW
jgi:Protein of unknown function (DUF3795)